MFVGEDLLDFINTLHGGWGVLGTSCLCHTIYNIHPYGCETNPVCGKHIRFC